MNNKVKELLLERYEVISRSADDCTYILADARNLSKEELENKLYTRFDRINSEMQVLDGYMKAWFKNTESYQLESSDVKVAKDDNEFTLDDIEEFKKGNMAVHCETEELARVLLDVFNKLNIQWVKGADNETEWHVCESQTCYEFDSEHNCLMYSDIVYFKNKGYKIKKFKGW